jgi:hypothetical protein
LPSEFLKIVIGEGEKDFHVLLMYMCNSTIPKRERERHMGIGMSISGL